MKLKPNKFKDCISKRFEMYEEYSKYRVYWRESWNVPLQYTQPTDEEDPPEEEFPDEY